MSEQTIKGTVKWFNDAKGFGFIQHPNGQDVFVHFSVIEQDGFKTLKDGEEVEYVCIQGPKGFNAQKVTRVNPPVKTDAAKSETKVMQAHGSNLTYEVSIEKNQDATNIAILTEKTNDSSLLSENE